MCNLYSFTRNQDAIRQLFAPRLFMDRTGNLAPPLTGIYPDQLAPIVRTAENGLEMVMARWGPPSPPQFHSKSGIRKREDVAAEVADGAVLMPVPYIPADTALARVNISLERGLLRAIDENARARGMTRSSFLASSARRELVGTA